MFLMRVCVNAEAAPDIERAIASAMRGAQPTRIDAGDAVIFEFLTGREAFWWEFKAKRERDEIDRRLRFAVWEADGTMYRIKAESIVAMDSRQLPGWRSEGPQPPPDTAHLPCPSTSRAFRGTVVRPILMCLCGRPGSRPSAPGSPAPPGSCKRRV